MVRVLFLICLMMPVVSYSIPSNAQFGGFLNKAKKAAEEKLKSQKDEALKNLIPDQGNLPQNPQTSNSSQFNPGQKLGQNSDVPPVYTMPDGAVILGGASSRPFDLRIIKADPSVLDQDREVFRIGQAILGYMAVKDKGRDEFERKQRAQEIREEILKLAPSAPDRFVSVFSLTFKSYDPEKGGLPLENPWEFSKPAVCGYEICYTTNFQYQPTIRTKWVVDKNAQIDFLKIDPDGAKKLLEIQRTWNQQRREIKVAVVFSIKNIVSLKNDPVALNINPYLYEAQIEIESMNVYAEQKQPNENNQLNGLITSINFYDADQDLKAGKDYDVIKYNDKIIPILLAKKNGRILIGDPVLNGKFSKKNIGSGSESEDIFFRGYRRYLELVEIGEKPSILDNVKGFKLTNLLNSNLKDPPSNNSAGPQNNAASEFDKRMAAEKLQKETLPLLTQMPHEVPVKITYVQKIYLSNYDFDKSGFRLSIPPLNPIGLFGNISGSEPREEFISMPPEEARSLLEKLPTNRPVYIASNFTVNKILNRTFLQREIPDEPIGFVEGINLYSDAELTGLVHKF